MLDSAFFAVTVLYLVWFGLGFHYFSIREIAAAKLLTSEDFARNSQRAVFSAAIAVARGSQFFFNLPIALGGGRRGNTLWSVLVGPMLLIFVVDAALMFASAALCVAFWFFLKEQL
jgi:hypothetical protein